MKCNYLGQVGAVDAQNELEAVDVSAVVQLVPESFHPASVHVYVGVYVASHFLDVEL
jgi:hypothetical protein